MPDVRLDLATALAHKGDYVIYLPIAGRPESGEIVNAEGLFVYVRYDGDRAVKATLVSDLVLQAGRCPDGGTCHHLCATAAACFRVDCCGPLSGVYPGDRWPAEVLAEHVPGGGVL